MHSLSLGGRWASPLLTLGQDPDCPLLTLALNHDTNPLALAVLEHQAPGSNAPTRVQATTSLKTAGVHIGQWTSSMRRRTWLAPQGS